MKRIVSILLSGVCFIGTAYSQSVADLARQERARKAGAEAKITITNETLKNSSAPEPSVVGKPAPAGQATGQPAAAEATSSGPTDRKGRDEKWWRTAFAETRAELKSAEDKVQIIQVELNQTHQAYLNRSDIYNREGRLAPEINALNADLQSQQLKAEDARKKIEDLVDELRRAGGPPGWAR